MVPDVRRVQAAELREMIEAIGAAFLEQPDVDRVVEDVAELWDRERTWAAFDGGRICGTFRSWATELTLPGGARLPAAAVSAVTVLPTHRRQGILRAMVAAEHAAIRERGEAVALLHASEYPIYGRFGYGPACREATWTLDARVTGFHGQATGSVELVRADAASRDAIRAVFEAWRERQAGEIRRRDVRWDFELGLRDPGWEPRWKGFLALHRDAGGAVDGYARYRADDTWERRQPRLTLKLDELHALTDAAHADLWRFLAAIDWVATITAERRSPAERLPWLLTNARAAAVSDVGDGMWVRPFDVPRLLEARTYGRAASVVVELVDPEAPGGRTRVALDAGPDGATARPTDRSPSVTLSVAALGAACLGGTRLRDAVLADGVDEHATGALADLDALLRTPDEPWCSTFF